MGRTRPNVLLITTDQQRYDALGANGNAMLKTPNIDALARDGVRFESCFVQNTVCVPSRACIQTGRYTHQHGVTYMETVVDDTPGLPEHELTFMEHLQRAGYFTGAAGKIHMYPEKGFHRHELTGGKGQRWLVAHGSALGPGPLGPKYSAWLEAKRPGAYDELYAARRAQPSYALLGVMDIPLTSDEYIETWIAEKSLEIVDAASGGSRPFFLWCGFCGPHGPFDPPEPYRSMYRPADVPLPLELEGWPSWREKWDEPLIRRAVAYYWAMVSCIDDRVGAILRALERARVLDETLVVFTSDHGEMLGERGRMGKSVFYDSVLRVPLVVRPPRSSPGRAGSTDALTEAMDIAPTILDYAGVPIPPGMSAHSLRPLIEERRDDTGLVHSEYVHNDRSDWSKCVRSRTHKYVRWFASRREELYDLAADPLEQHDLAKRGGEPARLEEMRLAMLDWLARTESRRSYA
jgi:arylsulfatase